MYRQTMPRLATLFPAAFLVLALSCDSENHVERRSVTAMGTVIELTAVGDDPASLLEALDAAEDELRSVESWASLFDPASELSRLNAKGGAESVSEPLRFILDLALEVGRLSDGTFDITTAPLSRLYRLTREEKRLPTPEELSEALDLVDYRRVVLDGSRVELPPGFSLDLGGIVKGYAVDRALEAMRTAGLSGGLVNAGGDLACFGVSPGGGAWRVGIRHPRDPDDLFTVVDLHEGALATSGDYERYYIIDGERIHHILDPRTGEPARESFSATVRAPSCALADALATVVFILGPVDGLALLEADPDLEGLVIDHDLAYRSTADFFGPREPCSCCDH